MADEDTDQLPVVDEISGKVIGVLSYREIISAYRHPGDENNEILAISLKRRALKMLVHGKKRLFFL